MPLQKSSGLAIFASSQDVDFPTYNCAQEPQGVKKQWTPYQSQHKQMSVDWDYKKQRSWWSHILNETVMEDCATTLALAHEHCKD